MIPEHKNSITYLNVYSTAQQKYLGKNSENKKK